MNRLILLPLLFQSAYGVNNGLAKTPQMGWNDWNSFGCNLDQSLILNTASLIKKYGLQDSGYHYVVLDDCWSTGRDSSGRIVADSKKFPNGMAWLGQQLHGQGYGFGMYSSAGTATCAGYAASLGKETIDAQTFASWGVDYLKYDNCNNQGQNGSPAKSSARYKAMGDALAATGRPILYSLCSWGEDSVWDWGRSIGNSWRVTGDITNKFNTKSSSCPSPNSGGYGCSVTSIMLKAAQIPTYGGPGGWNDLDMLEVGNGGMSDAEQVTHFTMWSVAKSPLIMGNPMTKIGASDLSILLNPAIIAVNQDPLGKPAAQRWVRNDQQMWSGQLTSTTGGTTDMVVVLVNLGGSTATISATMSEIFGGSVPAGTWEIRDLWAPRLSTAQAQGILNSGASSNPSLVYNATAKSYQSGLAGNDAKLLGTTIGTVASSGSVSGSVVSHGVKAFRLRLSGTGAGTPSTTAGSTSAGPTTTSAPPSGSSGQLPIYSQCGGTGWTGSGACVSGTTCKFVNDYYSQCL